MVNFIPPDTLLGILQLVGIPGVVFYFGINVVINTKGEIYYY